MGSFPTIPHPPRASTTSPTNVSGQNRLSVGTSETRLPNRTSDSPLKVRKTRENLRTGFIDDAASTNGRPLHDLAESKHSGAQPLREIQNTVHNEAARPSSRNNRFSWESDTPHLTTVIEPSPTKRTTSQSEKTGSKSAPTLSRKLSVRKRVVSRVREGLLNRSKSSSKVPTRADDDVAISRSASEHARFAQITPNDPSEDMEEGTGASLNLASGSVQSFVSNHSPLEDTGSTIDILFSSGIETKSILPGSNGSYPSPLQEGKPSPSPSLEKTPRPRRFPQSSQTHFENPKPLSMLHVNLSVKPAWETLDLADNGTMWAMIKAEASHSSDLLPTRSMSDICRPASPEHVAKTQKLLNLIVIIDNSSVLFKSSFVA